MLIINSTGWNGRTDLIYRKRYAETRQFQIITWTLPGRRLPYLHGGLVWFVPYPEAERWEKL